MSDPLCQANMVGVGKWVWRQGRMRLGMHVLGGEMAAYLYRNM